MTTRSVEFLIDNHVPYSEMNEEEIDSVIEWRAARKAESEEARMRQVEFERTQAAIINLAENEASNALNDFENIVGRVTARALAVEEVMKSYE